MSINEVPLIEKEIEPEKTQSSATPEVEAQNIATSPVLDFLSTANGSQIATQMITVFQGLQQHGTKTQSTLAKFDKLITCILIVVVIAAVTGLTYVDKFTPSIGVLFGSLVGYIYGKKS